MFSSNTTNNKSYPLFTQITFIQFILLHFKLCCKQSITIIVYTVDSYNVTLETLAVNAANYTGRLVYIFPWQTKIRL